ncbi:Ig-like domain repeat protein [Methanobrevibacter sp.]|uniref:Ig-like domain repeat protein n=1 Tax=Methanobrevibacter sp. TaxID=66852 RepID=UPI003868513D
MKHKKLLLVFSILFVLLCSLTAISASDLNDTDVIANDDVTEETVSSDADIENDITTEPDSGTIYGNTFTDLKNIVAGGGNVNLTRDYTYNESTDEGLYSQGVVIDQDNVVIDGNGKSINGEMKSRVFHIINANNVTLKNINFINSGYRYLNVDGGALYIEESSNITIINCKFEYDYADEGNGGAIYVKSTDPIRIIDSEFEENHAKYGGAITTHNATLILENATFIDNQATEIGGAINGAQSTQIINNCRFLANAIYSGSGGDRMGGAIYAEQFDEDNEIVITNTEFLANNVYNYGGAVYIKDQAKVPKVLIEDSKFSKNSAGTGGGAIFCGIANVTIRNTEFNENHGSDGGAVNAGPSTLIEDCNFTGNTAWGDYGGAIYVRDLGGENANATVKNCNFLNNSAEVGGAILNQKTVTVLNCNFTGNYAGFGGAINSQAGKALIYNSNFVANNATKGGAIMSSSDMLIENSYFIANNATDGGAIYTFDSDIEIDNSHFIENSAVAGGAISAPSNRKALINNSDFSQNTASCGGAIVVIGDVYDDSEITVENSIFAQNTDTEGTGDIALQNEKSKATLINVTPSNLVPKYIVEMDVAEVSDVNYTQTVNLKAFNIKRFGQPLNNGTVVFSINGKNISASVQNGIATLPVFLGAGSYKVDVTYVGDAENANPTKTIEFNVLKLPAVLEVINVTNCTYGDSIQIKANVTSNGSALNEGRIFIIVNGKKYSADVANGTATIDAPMIAAGTYSVNLTYEGNYFADNVSAKFEVSISTAVMTAKNIAYIINYGGKYSAVLKDINGKAVVGEKVTFTLNGKSIGSAVTDKNGVASIQLTPAILKAAKAGNKKLVIKLVSSNYKPLSKIVKVTINKEKTKILKAKKTYKFKKSKKAKNIKVTLKNSKNKVIKNVKVTIKLSGKKIKGKKTVTAKTNKKGVVTFKLGKKLTKKTKVKYTITFKGNAYYNKVVKKGKIIVK